MSSVILDREVITATKSAPEYTTSIPVSPRCVQDRRRTSVSKASVSKPVISEATLWKAGFFAGLTFVAYLGSSLAGHVLAAGERENVKQLGIQVVALKKIEKDLIEKIGSVNPQKELNKYIAERGFVRNPSLELTPKNSFGNQFVASR